jgi:hypothetical protein
VAGQPLRHGVSVTDACISMAQTCRCCKAWPRPCARAAPASPRPEAERRARLHRAPLNWATPLPRAPPAPAPP